MIDERNMGRKNKSFVLRMALFGVLTSNFHSVFPSDSMDWKKGGKTEGKMRCTHSLMSHYISHQRYSIPRDVYQKSSHFNLHTAYLNPNEFCQEQPLPPVPSPWVLSVQKALQHLKGAIDLAPSNKIILPLLRKRDIYLP